MRSPRSAESGRTRSREGMRLEPWGLGAFVFVTDKLLRTSFVALDQHISRKCPEPLGTARRVVGGAPTEGGSAGPGGVSRSETTGGMETEVSEDPFDDVRLVGSDEGDDLHARAAVAADAGVVFPAGARSRSASRSIVRVRGLASRVWDARGVNSRLTGRAPSAKVDRREDPADNRLQCSRRTAITTRGGTRAGITGGRRSAWRLFGPEDWPGRHRWLEEPPRRVAATGPRVHAASRRRRSRGTGCGEPW